MSSPTLAATAEKKTERPQLLFFYDQRSGRSRRVEAFLAQVLQRRRNHDTFHVVRVDVGGRPDLAERFRVVQVPTLIVVGDHKIRGRLESPRGCLEIERLLTPWLR